MKVRISMTFNANSIFDKKYLYYGQSLKWFIVQFFD